jgi:hypothetical protein
VKIIRIWGNWVNLLEENSTMPDIRFEKDEMGIYRWELWGNKGLRYDCKSGKWRKWRKWRK